MAQHRLARAADQASFAESFGLIAPACIEGCGCAANDVFGSGHPHRLEQKASHCEAAFGPISHRKAIGPHRRTKEERTVTDILELGLDTFGDVTNNEDG